MAFLGRPGGDMDELPELYTSLNNTMMNQSQNLDVEDRIAQKIFKDSDGKGDFIPLINPRYISSMTDIKPKERKTIIVPVNPHKSYTLQERIEQSQNGTIIRLCITDPLSRSIELSMNFQNEKGKIQFNLDNNFVKLDDGTLEMVNQYLLKKQKQVVGYLLKQLGTALVTGKSVMSISMPIGIFEARSQLERLGDNFVYAPHFLEKAGQMTDTWEAFKWATTFYLTNMVADLQPEKPFNPVLGETFQGVIGGCHYYAEQISHHPPISAFQLEGQHFKIDGHFWLTANTSANSVKFRKVGDFRLIFKNTGQVVQVQWPVGMMNGTSFGKRTWIYTKKFQVYDFKNQYYAEIDFDRTDIAKKKRDVSGYVLGNMYKVTEKFCTKAQQDLKKQKDVEIKFKEKDHATAKMDRLEGSWLNALSINDKVYWSQANPWPYKLQYFDNPLPSDCNFRLDLLHLKAGDDIKAQEAKIATEDSQRKDKKLREQWKSKHYK